MTPDENVNLTMTDFTRQVRLFLHEYLMPVILDVCRRKGQHGMLRFAVEETIPVNSWKIWNRREDDMHQLLDVDPTNCNRPTQNRT